MSQHDETVQGKPVAIVETEPIPMYCRGDLWVIEYNGWVTTSTVYALDLDNYYPYPWLEVGKTHGMMHDTISLGKN